MLRPVGWLKYYKLNKPGSHKVGIRAILTVVTQAWSSLGYFGKPNFEISNEFESLSKFSDFTPYLS